MFDPGALLMNHQTNSTPRPNRLPAVRRITLPWALWVFGLSTTLLLVGLWGRAVTVDDDTIARSTEAALSADLVTERVYDWIGSGLAATTGITEAESEQVLEEVRAHPAAAGAIDDLIDGVVRALIAPPGAETSIDVAAALTPLVPEVVSELEAQGIDVPPGAVETAVEDLDPVTLDTGEAVSVGVVTDQASAILTRGVVIAAVMLTVAGVWAVLLSEDRWPMVRSLATRVSFSALSFAALFRIGGWVLDPDGGRSPLRRSGSILVRSNLDVFLIVAGLAAAVAAAIWLIRRTPPQESGVDNGTIVPLSTPEMGSGLCTDYRLPTTEYRVRRAQRAPLFCHTLVTRWGDGIRGRAEHPSCRPRRVLRIGRAPASPRSGREADRCRRWGGALGNLRGPGDGCHRGDAYRRGTP